MLYENKPTLSTAKLIVQPNDGSRPREVALTAETAIGRLDDNTIQLISSQVSRYHARIFSSADGWMLQDLGSMNGTLLNGKPVNGATVLHTGDQLNFGDVRCVFLETHAPLESLLRTDTGTSADRRQTQLVPVVQAQFLPQTKISNEAVLRQDYEKLRLTYELQKEIGSEINTDSLLAKILACAFQLLECDQGVVLLADETGALKPLAFKARKPGREQVISSTLVQCVQDKRLGIIWADVLSDRRTNQSESLILRGVRSSMAVPILDGERLLGAIIVEAFQKIGAFSEKDLNLMTTIANHACQFIKNAMLHKELKTSFDSAITTLSAVVDARHPLTAGHSERVAYYAMLIGKELRLEDHRLEALRLAALLHDIGKIGVRDDVLFKKGPFGTEERREMQAHVHMTRTILEKFHFPQILQDIPEVAAFHHERFDGNGYPEGLTGEKLPLETRILTVADVFDALTSPRDYPKYDEHKTLVKGNRLPLADVVAVIEQKSGIDFDPAVINAFKRCLPRALAHFRGKHFSPDYVDSMLANIAPWLLCETTD